MSSRRFLGVVFVLLMQSLPGSPSARAGGAAVSGCASHDLAAFNLVEKHGEDQSLPAEVVVEAAMKLLDARVACRDGRAAETIAIYADLNARLAATAGHR
jgi:hypothetical protein